MKTKVLVADDNESILTLLKVQLSTEGYETILAKNGREALEKIRNDNPDIILLDVMMPEMNGFEVAKEVKSDPTLNHIPIIMVTARAEFESKTTGIESGADDYVTKPIDFKDLMLKVKALLRIKNLNDKIREQKQELEHQLNLAKKLQNKLLSFPIPEISKIEIFSNYLSSAGLNGDIFYIKEINKNKLFFIVADVSCQGVEAALIMLLFNSFLHYGFEKIGIEKIEELMFYLNNELLNMDIDSNFITAFAGIIDADKNKLTYINAGHIDGFLFNTKDDYVLLTRTSSVLGGSFTVEFKAKEISLKEKSKILIITKGIFNEISKKKEINIKILTEFLLNNYNENLKFMIDNIKKELTDKPEDDIIILGFQIKK